MSLQTSYRSTKSIMKLARHLSKCLKKTFATDSDSDGLGSDLEGTKPMFFDTGRCDPSDLQSSILRLRYALETAEKMLGTEVTILYNISGYAELQKMVKMMSRKEGPWCYKAAEFYGCEADKVFLLIFFFFDEILDCSQGGGSCVRLQHPGDDHTGANKSRCNSDRQWGWSNIHGPQRLFLKSCKRRPST